MSSVFYRYENSLSKVVKGIKSVVKETLIDGTKEGVSFSYLEKNGDKFYRIKAKQLESGKFEVLEKKDEKESSKELSEAEVMKLVGANKNLKFVDEYMKKERAKLMKEHKEGGAKRKRTSKKSSKKASKKRASKKSSKKASKKRASKKGSKKASKKRASKKGSKKASKKVRRTSKKGSKKSASKKGSKKRASKKGSKKSSKRRVKKA